MKSLDLQQIGLQELSLNEKKEIEGGSLIFIIFLGMVFFAGVALGRALAGAN